MLSYISCLFLADGVPCRQEWPAPEVHIRGPEEGREAGRQEGREEGRALGMSDAVRKMATAGMSVDQIALILELDAEEIGKMLSVGA